MFSVKKIKKIYFSKKNIKMKKAPLTTGKQSKELKCITNVQVLYNHEPGISIRSIACNEQLLIIF
tara:strand:+ start:1175 stop:1369 length:195 start_codon:yes stop_codon:yes gene_type:complete